MPCHVTTWRPPAPPPPLTAVSDPPGMGSTPQDPDRSERYGNPGQPCEAIEEPIPSSPPLIHTLTATHMTTNLLYSGVSDDA